MSIWEIVLGAVLLLLAVVIVIIIMLQEGHQQGVGAIMGGSSDTFYSKHKSRSLDSFLARWTRIIAIVFFLLVIALNAIAFFS